MNPLRLCVYIVCGEDMYIMTKNLIQDLDISVMKFYFPERTYVTVLVQFFQYSDIYMSISYT